MNGPPATSCRVSPGPLAPAGPPALRSGLATAAASGRAAALSWVRDGPAWPHRGASRFVEAGGLRWHVQAMGQGPVLLLLHGTGASTHSWRDLAPLLAAQFTILAADLPGHAFTTAPPAPCMSLPEVSAGLGDLVDALGVEVAWVLGHSAGAAIAAQMVLDRCIAPRGLLGISAALLPFDGMARWLFPAAARLASSSALAARLVAHRARDLQAVRQLIESTGSALDPAGIAFYARLMQDPRHVGSVLHMLAHWNLQPLAARLCHLPVPVALLAGERDRAVPLEQVRRSLALLQGSPSPRLTVLPGAGHLAHEEDPPSVAAWVRQAVQELSARPPALPTSPEATR